MVAPRGHVCFLDFFCDVAAFDGVAALPLADAVARSRPWAPQNVAGLFARAPPYAILCMSGPRRLPVVHLTYRTLSVASAQARVAIDF